MTTRDSAPTGSPCWADLWTSDVEGSRRFYSELFGWEAAEPNPEFGGYFMFNRDGVPTAGCMGAMEGVTARDLWTIYLATDDITGTLKAAEAEGAEIVSPEMAIAEIGIQAEINDPTGARVGLWQPKEFHGFTVLGEPGTPSWFELHTSDHARAVSFYTSVFGLETVTVGDTDDFRYTLVKDPLGDGEVAGIMDASRWLPEGESSRWHIYIYVVDPDATVAKATALGGSVIAAPESTPYGVLATLADPAGAQFRLHTPNP
jgi:uncharacterized protein